MPRITPGALTRTWASAALRLRSIELSVCAFTRAACRRERPATLCRSASAPIWPCSARTSSLAFARVLALQPLDLRFELEHLLGLARAPRGLRRDRFHHAGEPAVQDRLEVVPRHPERSRRLAHRAASRKHLHDHLQALAHRRRHFGRRRVGLLWLCHVGPT